LAYRARHWGIWQRKRLEFIYEGELDILHKAHNEVEYLIKMDEIRRLHKLCSDMYYEILARTIPPNLGFKRRIERPYLDPVNAMLSFGYAILNGACRISVIGAHLDPDRGFLNEGAGSLIHDLIEPLKPRMVDQQIFELLNNGISPEDYEIGSSRCHLSERLTNQIAHLLRDTIVQEEIDTYIVGLKSSMINNEEFAVIS
jgi:CRISPR-associated endonuclease Cas1